MTIMEYLNIALIIALIIFSAWCFYLRFKSSKICTTKDLLLAFVTGGSLAVTTLVFGVAGDIKSDTRSIRTTLGVEREVEMAGEVEQAVEVEQAGKAEDMARERPIQNVATTNDIENLARLITQNARTLQMLASNTEQINANIAAGLTCVLVPEQNNSLNQGTLARPTINQLTQLNFICRMRE